MRNFHTPLTFCGVPQRKWDCHELEGLQPTLKNHSMESDIITEGGIDQGKFVHGGMDMSKAVSNNFASARKTELSFEMHESSA